MKFFTKAFASYFVCSFVFTLFISAQNVPEVLYYKFKNNSVSGTPNYANPGRGSLIATKVGLTFTSGGQFDTCLSGTGITNTYLNSGWSTNIGTGNWTISLWMNSLVNMNPTYLFGDSTSGAFRCFYGGAAGPGNLILRGNFPDVFVPAVIPGPTVVHFVYDGSNIIVYKNGVVFGNFPATNLNLTGSGPFKVAGYATGTGINGKIDEFRFYDRALSASEIALTWNQELPIITGIGSNSNSSLHFNLYQNYPNPFNPYTSIKYVISEDGYVAFKVFDVLGKEVFNSYSFKQKGSHEFIFDGTGIPSGEYFYKMETSGFKNVKKMILVK